MSKAEISAEEKVLQLEKKLADSTAKIMRMEHQLNQLLRMLYGSKSERHNPLQPNLFSAPTLPFSEEELKGDQSITLKQEIVKEHTRTKFNRENAPSREVLPEHLRRVVEIIEPDPIPEGAVRIGEEITETLEFDPGELFVKRIIRPKYALADKSAVVIGELPLHPIPKCKAGLTLLLRILIDKYVDHLPLNRQIERYLRQHGVRLSESTMCDWVKQIVTLLEPLYDLMTKEVLSSSYIGADETTVKVLDRRIRGKTHRGYFWVYLAHEKNLVIFDYDPSRKKKVPGNKLRNFKGYLQTDGYAGYEQFSTHAGITRVGCMAHARRMFESALTNDRVRAEYALAIFQQIYRVEHWARVLGVRQERMAELRQKLSVPRLNELKTWMAEQISSNTVTPKSPMYKAIGYAQSFWKELNIYTQDGRLYIDNNHVENKIRPVAIGRKNYLFMGSHESSQRSAMLYSFFQSCALNKINPEIWLLDVLKHIADTKTSQLHTLLPSNWGKATS